MKVTKVIWSAVGSLIFLVGCQSPVPAERVSPAASPSTQSASPQALPAQREEKQSWRKPRFISVAEAVDRLQPHLDVPVVLPADRMAGLPNLKGWLADPKYLEWRPESGVRTGTIRLVKKNQLLILSYGLAGFDGCGDRSMAIETDVLDQPALVIPSSDRWSTIVWPVTESGSTGRFGISGTFNAVAMVRLAESMEQARAEAADSDEGC